MTPEQRIITALSDVPNQMSLPVLQDVNQRIADWRSSGGADDSDYIEQQVRYAENVKNAYERSVKND